MCKSIGRCVAIALIVVGVLNLSGGIFSLVAPKILDCEKLSDDIAKNDDITDICNEFLDVSQSVGIAMTSVGGIMVVVGIIMLCCLRSNPVRIVHAAPVMATVHPGYPQPSPYQYDNAMMNPQHQYPRNPLAQQPGGMPRAQAPPAQYYPELKGFSQHS